MALLPYQKLSADQMVTFSDCVWHSFLKAQGWVGQGHVHSPETSVTRGKPPPLEFWDYRHALQHLVYVVMKITGHRGLPVC